jgi:hypothetical protein
VPACTGLFANQAHAAEEIVVVGSAEFGEDAADLFGIASRDKP